MLGETILKFIIGIIAIKMGGNIPLLILANSVPAILSTMIVIPIKIQTRKRYCDKE